MNEYREEIELILDNIYEAVCIIDVNYNIKFWNQAAEKLYGYKKEDLIGQNIKEKFPNALLVKTLENKLSYKNIKHRPNTRSHVILSTSPIIIGEDILGAISTDRDITEVESLSKALNDEIEKNKNLQSHVKKLEGNELDFTNMVSKSRIMEKAIDLSVKVGKTDASILLTGESGTGKDVFARAIHKESGRSGSFIPINCSAIPGELLESELFGYEKGAFTGARDKGKPGKFELAHEGTIFLDEIGDMPFSMQAKLLRVLQDGVVYRIGGSEGIKVNSRIISATNKDLKKMMEAGEFREDLYYRLNVVSIHLPPLRDRKEDIPGLIDSFIGEFSRKNKVNKLKIKEEALDLLVNYSWKGNIRELRNIVERMVILNNNKDEIGLENIPKDIKDGGKLKLDLDKSDLNTALSNLERAMILDALEKNSYNKMQAAKALGIKRTTLYYKMDQYGIR